MSDKARNYEQEIANLTDSLSEAVFEMSDDEVRADIKETGDTTDTVRHILLQAFKDYRQRNLIEAQHRYQERAEAMKRKNFSLPDSIQGMRDLLNSFLIRNPIVGASLLTAQHRDFNDLPDEDLPGYLKQLVELGEDNE
jgi:hypothetical protein